MTADRRVRDDRVIIDGVLFERHAGRRARPCCICDLDIPAGEERYIPIRPRERKALVYGKRTRICVPCVAGRLARAGRAAA